MKRFSLFSLALVGLTGNAFAASPLNILFVGNSFTHGNISPVYSYNNTNITDANGTSMGGVPGIFKQLTVQAGLNFNVTIEAVSAQDFAYHIANKASIIDKSTWNDVVLQDYSTDPLPTNRGGDPDEFFSGATTLKSMISSHSGAKTYLYETWARPGLVFPSGQPYFGTSLQTMQTDLHNSYYKANTDNAFNGVSPVGDAFMRAIAEGVGNPNPYSTPQNNTVNLWDTDQYHASAYGSYLSALVMLDEITGYDPRKLSTGTGTAAAGLGLDSAIATKLDTIAYEAVPEPSLMAVAGVALFGLTGRRRTARKA